MVGTRAKRAEHNAAPPCRRPRPIDSGRPRAEPAPGGTAPLPHLRAGPAPGGAFAPCPCGPRPRPAGRLPLPVRASILRGGAPCPCGARARAGRCSRPPAVWAIVPLGRDGWAHGTAPSSGASASRALARTTSGGAHGVRVQAPQPLAPAGRGSVVPTRSAPAERLPTTGAAGAGTAPRARAHNGVRGGAPPQRNDCPQRGRGGTAPVGAARSRGARGGRRGSVHQPEAGGGDGEADRLAPGQFEGVRLDPVAEGDQPVRLDGEPQPPPRLQEALDAAGAGRR
ncbi:hypothetical protein EDD98_4598 [Streptomyces sp. PanSC19]|nr:hypothetical protein EDD98_4598 [Streptomyces sp. PanSC19]